MKGRLLRLWRRAVHCRRGEHRDTVDFTGGAAWRVRCVDCGRTELKGWVFAGVSNHKWGHHA